MEKKYLILWGATTETLEEKINEVSETYSLRETFKDANTFYATLGLRESSKYDDIDKYRSFPITGEEQTLPDGWLIIHHTSKELIGVTKHDGDRGV